MFLSGTQHKNPFNKDKPNSQWMTPPPRFLCFYPQSLSINFKKKSKLYKNLDLHSDLLALISSQNKPKSIPKNLSSSSSAMILYLLPPSITTTSSISTSRYTNGNKLKTLFLPSSFLPISSIKLAHLRSVSNGRRFGLSPCCSLLEAPVLWAGRLCIFYALLKAGLAGSPSNPIISSGLISIFFSNFCFWVFCFFYLWGFFFFWW